MDRRAWWAIQSGVETSKTRLSNRKHCQYSFVCVCVYIYIPYFSLSIHLKHHFVLKISFSFFFGCTGSLLLRGGLSLLVVVGALPVAVGRLFRAVAPASLVEHGALEHAASGTAACGLPSCGSWGSIALQRVRSSQAGL